MQNGCANIIDVVLAAILTCGVAGWAHCMCGGRWIPTTAAKSLELWSPLVHGVMDATWTWRELPPMSVGRYGCGGCMLSDGRFALLGGISHFLLTSSCEAKSFGADGHWTPLPPMQEARSHFVCAAIAECIIVAGGWHCPSAEVYDEVLVRWLRLPCNLPQISRELGNMGSVLM